MFNENLPWWIVVLLVKIKHYWREILLVVFGLIILLQIFACEPKPEPQVDWQPAVVPLEGAPDYYILVPMGVQMGQMTTKTDGVWTELGLWIAERKVLEECVNIRLQDLASDTGR